MPVALIIAMISSVGLLDKGGIYTLVFLAQALFYSFALVGYFKRNQITSIKYFHIPFYFTFMHICVVKGWIRYWKGKQSVTWEKSIRAVPEFQTSKA
jgi:hypothetical protein